MTIAKPPIELSGTVSDYDGFHDCLDQIDWYRRCLEDLQDGRPVRNLDEAKSGYDSAMDQLRAIGRSA